MVKSNIVPWIPSSGAFGSITATSAIGSTAVATNYTAAVGKLKTTPQVQLY